MPKRIRTFIAVAVADPVLRQLVALQHELRLAAPDVKWVDRENLHLTLKFLGEVNETDLYKVCKTAEQAVAEQAVFEMNLVGVGAFPTAHRPRIIWAGVGSGADELSQMHHKIETAFRAQGYPREDRPFTPHLTLGRMRQPEPTPQLAAALANLANWSGGVTQVQEILVMSSRLSPSGPTYSVMSRGRLLD
jgi:2'-5' RNA ligase